MREYLSVDASQPALRRILDAVGSRKRKASVEVSESVCYSGTYWDGGSRTEYTAVSLSDFRAVNGARFNPPQFGGPRVDPVVAVPPGIVIVEHGTFCGKPATPCVHVNPADAVRFLPAPSAVPTLPDPMVGTP